MSSRGLRTTPPDAREVTLAREAAEEGLLGYAEALRYWNAPDEEHTRLQLHGLVDDVIDEVFGG